MATPKKVKARTYLRDPTTKKFLLPKPYFGRKGQKPPKVDNFGLKVCSLENVPWKWPLPRR